MVKSLESKKSIISLLTKYGDYLIENGIIGFEDKTSKTWFVEKNGKIVTDDFSLNGNSGIALFFAYLSIVAKTKYFIYTSQEAMLEPIEKIIFDNKFDLNVLIDVVFVLSNIYKNLDKNNLRITIIKGIDIISYYIINNPEQAFKYNLNILISSYELFDFNKKQLMKLFKVINNFLYKKYKIGDLEFLNKNHMNDLIIYLARASKISHNEKMNKVISKLLQIQRHKKIIPNNKNLLSRLMLKESQYPDDIIDKEIYDGLKKVMNDEINLKNKNLSGLYDIVKKLDIMEYAKNVCGDELIDDNKNFYIKEILNHPALKVQGMGK